MQKTSKKIPMLSKSKYVAGMQCFLRLWQQCYNPELASETSPVQQAIFDTGHEVGRLATQLYPGGVLIEEDHHHHEEAVKTTLVAMQDPAVKAIYEAGFLFDDVRVRVDVLERVKNGRWNLIEVKSSTRIKDEYYPDVGIQYYVLKGSGLDIDRVFLMHLNNQYVYDGIALDLEGLFSVSDLTEGALVYQQEVPQMLAELKDMLANANPPEMAPSKHCNKPYGCDFWEYC
ncbi:MAG: Dna2/Cas4 domain-containing protein, partial [Desulfobacteraceae bacterium]